MASWLEPFGVDAVGPCRSILEALEHGGHGGFEEDLMQLLYNGNAARSALGTLFVVLAFFLGSEGTVFRNSSRRRPQAPNPKPNRGDEGRAAATYRRSLRHAHPECRSPSERAGARAGQSSSLEHLVA